MLVVLFIGTKDPAIHSLKATPYTLIVQWDGFGGNKNEITVGSLRKCTKKMMISDKKYKFAKSKHVKYQT